MSTIPEIQAQLRQTAEELSERINRLTQELSEVQAAREPALGKESPELERLVRLGQRKPIPGHPAHRLGPASRVNYLAPLCAIALAAPHNEDALLLLQRVASGLELSSLEQPIAVAMSMGEKDLDGLIALLDAECLSTSLLLDAMLVRACCGADCPRADQLLEDLVLLLGPEETRVTFLARLAAALGRQDGDAVLELWREEDFALCPGGCYLQESSGVLYTDDPEAAKAHGLRRVILHDCLLTRKDDEEPLVLEQCVLLNCTIECDIMVVTFQACLLSECLLLQYRSPPSFLFFFPKSKFIASTLRNCEFKHFLASTNDTRTYSIDDFCIFDATNRDGITYRQIRADSPAGKEGSREHHP